MIGPNNDEPITFAAMGNRAGKIPPFYPSICLWVSNGILALKVDVMRRVFHQLLNLLLGERVMRRHEGILNSSHSSHLRIAHSVNDRFLLEQILVLFPQQFTQHHCLHHLLFAQSLDVSALALVLLVLLQSYYTQVIFSSPILIVTCHCQWSKRGRKKKKIALCKLRWFKLNVSKCQKMSSCQEDAKCQIVKHLDYGGGSEKK